MSRLRAGAKAPPQGDGDYELVRRLEKAEKKLQHHDRQFRARVNGWTSRSNGSTRQRPPAAATLVEVLAAQIGAIEERLQKLSDKIESGYDANRRRNGEARSLLHEVREEHRRIRVRFGAVTRYEERLRRLESALAEEMAAAEKLASEARGRSARERPDPWGGRHPQDPPYAHLPGGPGAFCSRGR